MSVDIPVPAPFLFAEEFVRRGKAEFGEAFDVKTARSYWPDIPFYGSSTSQNVA